MNRAVFEVTLPARLDHVPSNDGQDVRNGSCVPLAQHQTSVASSNRTFGCHGGANGTTLLACVLNTRKPRRATLPFVH
jgi:hypothetical protein